MLRSIAVIGARWTPSRLKQWVHKHKYLSRFARKTFAGVVGIGGNVVEIQTGPLKGIKLVVSQHVSHAHYKITTLEGEPFRISGPIIPGVVQVIGLPPQRTGV